MLPREADIVAAVHERHPDGIQAVLDLVSYQPGTFDATLKDGGHLASPLQAAGDGPGRTNVMAVPTAENLARLGELLSRGGLRVPIMTTYPLAPAPTARRARDHPPPGQAGDPRRMNDMEIGVTP